MKARRIRILARSVEDELLSKPRGPVQMRMPREEDKMQIRALRHQKTCLVKRLREANERLAAVRAGQRIIKWAKRFVQSRDPKFRSDWNFIQLKIAVKRAGKKEGK